MGPHKRKDHVFNLSLKKTLEELSDLVQQVLNQELRGKNIHGASERADRLKKVLSSLRDGLRNPAFDLTVDKPPGGPSGDLNSQMHGEAKKQMVFAFRQFLEALKGWEIASGEAARVLQLRMLHTACLNLRLAIGKWIDTAVDSEAEMISKREDPKTAGVIAGGRSYLEHMRDDLINLLKLYTP
jgi:hypothetical protein